MQFYYEIDGETYIVTLSINHKALETAKGYVARTFLNRLVRAGKLNMLGGFIKATAQKL